MLLGKRDKKYMQKWLEIPIPYVCLEDTAREGVVIRRNTEMYIDYQMWLQWLKSRPLIYFIISDLEIDFCKVVVRYLAG
jgi:hypothetical protein